MELTESLAGFPPPVAKALAETVAAGPRYAAAGDDAKAAPLAVLDWDNTCIWNDIGDASFDRMASRAAVALDEDELRDLLPEAHAGRPRRAPIQALLARGRAGDAAARAALRAELWALYDDLADGTPEGETRRYRWAARLMAGRSAEALEALGDETIEEGLREPLGAVRLATQDGARAVTVARGLRLLRPVVALIAALRAHGWDVNIVSASCAPLVRAFARRIGLPPASVLGVNLAEPVRGGRLSPRLVEPFPYREGKLATIERFLGRMPFFVAGDSAGDLAMLRAASTRLVVARAADAPAAVEGRAKGWLVVPQAELLRASGETPPGEATSPPRP